MLTFKKFTGLDNVTPSERLKQTELTVAMNVDVNNDGELLRRVGYTQDSAVCHKNVWQAHQFMLATYDGGDLRNVTAGTTLYAALGVDRVWYCNLPDGRTTFSNGLINGITDGTTTTKWGVPIPASIGTPTDVAGDLKPGDYMYRITHVRLSDGLEGGALNSVPFTVADGGIVLTSLPTLAGHKTNVYLTSHNGSVAYLAGSTTGSMFSYTGSNDALVQPLKTENLYPAPVGTVTCFWRGHVLVAVGPVLYASRAGQWELFDLKRDFKQFSANITMIQPVDAGLFVGTEHELAYLDGTEFDKLKYSNVVSGGVILGSGVPMQGELIRRGISAGEPRMGNGTAMLCIADRRIVAGFSDGVIVRMTEDSYYVDESVTEVAATFRMRGNIPQYIAIAQ